MCFSLKTKIYAKRWEKVAGMMNVVVGLNVIVVILVDVANHVVQNVVVIVNAVMMVVIQGIVSRVSVTTDLMTTGMTMIGIAKSWGSHVVVVVNAANPTLVLGDSASYNESTT